MSQESDASFFSDLMYLFKIVRDVGMIPIKVVIGLFNFIKWCQNFHETTRNRIREFNARIKNALIQIEEYRKQAIKTNAPKPVLLALIRIRRYFTRMNRHGEEFVSILDEFERLKILQYNEFNKHEFSKLKRRINELRIDTKKTGWLKKLNRMDQDLEKKTGPGLRARTIPNLNKDIKNLENDISVLRQTNTPDTKFIEQRIVTTINKTRDLQKKDKRQGRVARSDSFDRIIKSAKTLEDNRKDAEVSRKINNLRSESNRMETIEHAKKVLTQVNLLSREINKSPIYSTSTTIKNDLTEIKNKALKMLPWYYRRLYFGDENLNDILKDYDKYKNQKSRDLNFGAVNRINELRQKIKTIIKKTSNTKFIKRLKKMNRRLKQKLLKRQRLLQQ